MVGKQAPETRPYGQSEYHNYDPEQVNTVEDAIGVFEWLSAENEDVNPGASAAFQEAANLLRREVNEE